MNEDYTEAFGVDESDQQNIVYRCKAAINAGKLINWDDVECKTLYQSF